MDKLLGCLDEVLPEHFLASEIIKREVRKSELVKICEVHVEQDFMCNDNEMWVYTAMDTEIEVGDEWPDEASGEMLTVTQVVRARPVLCYRQVLHNTAASAVGEVLHVLDGIEVHQGETTATVTAVKP